MDAFAFPFRFELGNPVKLDNASEAYAAQRVASIVQTRKGELILKPTYGTDDPEFAELDVAGLYLTLANYHVDLEVDEIEEYVEDDGEATYKISFSIRED